MSFKKLFSYTHSLTTAREELEQQNLVLAHIRELQNDLWKQYYDTIKVQLKTENKIAELEARIQEIKDRG